MSSVLQVMTINLPKEESNYLAMLDVGLGILPVISAYKEMLNHDSWKFDVHEFLVKYKAHALIQEAFSGPKFNEKTHSIINMAISEKILFEVGLHYEYYPNCVSDVFSKIPTYLKLIKYQNPEYIVEKTSVPEMPKMTKEMKNALEMPNLPFDHNLERNKILPDLQLFKKRINLTCKFAKEFEDPIKIQNFLKQKNPDLKILDKYEIRFTFPLVGTIRKQGNPTTLYVMTCYKTNTDVPIEQVCIETNNFIPYYIKHNPNIVSLLRECALLCTPAGHQANIRKLVTKPKDSNLIFVVYLITFSDNRLIPLGNTRMDSQYDYVNSLMSWESWMNRHDIINFGFGGEEN